MRRAADTSATPPSASEGAPERTRLANNEKRPWVSRVSWNGVAMAPGIDAEFTKSLIGQGKVSVTPACALKDAAKESPRKIFLGATIDRLEATQIRQKGSQKDRKRHRQSDKIRRRVTEY